MAKLSIVTNLDRILIIGEFCEWDFDKAIEVERKGKFIVIDDMPIGEYKCFSCKSSFGAEKYINGNQMGNRYFCSEFNEKIKVYF